jgi:peptidoglycan biosynthesis protein MviN/MurJ (putative lipid II flippase)
MSRPAVAALRGRLSAVHANHKRIAAGAVTIALLTIVAKLFVAAREVAIAFRYGISETVDAYQLALTIATWPALVLSGVVTVVLVPRLVDIRHRGSDRRGFVAELNGATLLVGILLAAGTWAAAPAVSALLAPAHDPALVRLTAGMASDMTPIAFCIVAAGYLSARLQSRERFGYTLTEAAAALSVALFVMSPLGLRGAEALIFGTVIGYLLQLVWLGGMVERGDPPLGSIAIRHRSGEWGLLYSFMLMMGLGQILIGAAVPVDQAFAARIGEGAVAVLGYANRIIILITGLATVVIGRALLPVLSSSVASGEDAAARRHAWQWGLLLFGAGAIAALLLWFLAPGIVRLLFQRGAFDDQASAQVTGAVRYGLLQLAPYCGGIVLVQWYAATGRFRALLAINASALAVKVGLNALLTPVFGVAGIMASTAGMYLLTSGAMAVAMGLTRASAVAPALETREEG